MNLYTDAFLHRVSKKISGMLEVSGVVETCDLGHVTAISFRGVSGSTGSGQNATLCLVLHYAPSETLTLIHYCYRTVLYHLIPYMK